MLIPLRAHLPTRVSRFYPLFALVLLGTSAALAFAWQHTLIDYRSLQGSVDAREQNLRAQVETLTRDQTAYRAQLQKLQSDIERSTTQLQAIQKELQAKQAELATKEEQYAAAVTSLKSQQDQLAANATELANLRARPPLFSFQNKSTLANVESKQVEIREIVTAAFSTIQEVYGQPYLLHQITITFVDQFSIAGSAGEIVIENTKDGISIDIHLNDFRKDRFQDVNTLLHEIIHGFHGVAVFESSALEEGITVAAADVVMAKLIAAGKLPAYPHLYLNLSATQYETYNQSLSIYADNDRFYAYPEVGKVYQLIGSAWYKLYGEDPNFFKALNEAYYPLMQQGKAIDTAAVHDAIRAVLPAVGGVPINDFLTANAAFNPE